MTKKNGGGGGEETEDEMVRDEPVRSKKKNKRGNDTISPSLFYE